MQLRAHALNLLRAEARGEVISAAVISAAAQGQYGGALSLARSVGDANRNQTQGRSQSLLTMLAVSAGQRQTKLWLGSM
jgi:hypothetical protein